ncbi:MAG: type II toxin-antitoxin system HicB family antitoxin [Verrucomicrobia bacterium]|nr:type II toxin-antitoxin system HicB family antitoxin [Verrucomicrobiota bacterium]
MLISYIQAAMRHAEFEQMEDGRWFGTIPVCPGLWADGDTTDQCREELQSALDDWIFVKVRHGDTIPLIDGVDINPKPVYAEAD